VQVNINPMYTPSELAHQLIDSGAETMVVYTGSTPVLAAALADSPVRHVITLAPGDGTGLPVPAPAIDAGIGPFTPLADALVAGAALDFTAPETTRDDMLFLQYTGGTTGPSKGAVLPHGNVLGAVSQFHAVLSDASVEGEEVLVGALPLFHIFGLLLQLMYVSLGGKTVLIPNPRDMAGMIDAIRDNRISVMGGVNTLYGGMVMHPDFKTVDFSGLKVALGGGSAIHPQVSEGFKAVTGRHITEGYGLSETCSLVSINPVDLQGFSGTIGRPFPDTRVVLLDDDGNRMPGGERGEICVAGPQVLREYWNRPGANAEAFTDDGYFRTGDIGVFDENGFLTIVDRKKDMIIVSGFNVFPNEVEAALCNHPEILEAACVGVPHKKTGEAVKVFLVIAPKAVVTLGDIRKFCRKHLTGYKIPREVVFLDQLPKSAVGKILRRELRLV
jgi:long-chain acyl-CoA synthetase